MSERLKNVDSRFTFWFKRIKFGEERRLFVLEDVKLVATLLIK